MKITYLKRNLQRMHWININSQRPTEDMRVYIKNDKVSPNGYQAIYHKIHNAFRFDEQRKVYSTPLTITHWVNMSPEINRDPARDKLLEGYDMKEGVLIPKKVKM